MLNYVFDGSFEGILTAIYEAYARRERPDQLLPAQGLAMHLFDDYVSIETDCVKADKVAAAIQLKCSAEIFDRVLLAAMADDPDRGTLINRYLRLGFRLGSAVDCHLHEPFVLDLHHLSHRVNREVMRFEGLLRFVKTSAGIFYARYEPDHNITQALAPHFAARLADQSWIIHDIRRGVAALYNTQEWILAEWSASFEQQLPDWSECEVAYQQIWKAYHHNIAIAERTNPKLQRNMMPARYWKNLQEMSDITGSSWR